MKRLDIFCFTHIASTKLEKIGYQMGGIKKKDFPDNYLTCDEKINIIEKEKYYSEYVFHYWFWKNKLKSYDKDNWVGFCQKRRFWLQKKIINKPTNFYDLNKSVLKVIPKEWENYDSIICPPVEVNNIKKMKMIKRGFKSIIKNPSIFYDKNKHTINLHFDMYHGYGNLDKAINVMNNNDKEDFRHYVNSQTSFSANNMFIAKKEVADKWFNDVFDWLFACEKIIGFKNLKGYETRMYAYLAERYLSFWFNKYANPIMWPWIFADLNNVN